MSSDLCIVFTLRCKHHLAFILGHLRSSAPLPSISSFLYIFRLLLQSIPERSSFRISATQSEILHCFRQSVEPYAKVVAYFETVRNCFGPHPLT